MSEVVIQVENLCKQYRLGATGSGSFQRDFQRWWAMTIRKQEDPSRIIGQESEVQNAARSERFLALNDVNFEVRHGDVWGIIGRNGAGKSTLLKIISRIIRPSSGYVRGKGKISSLLEVGTGFHQELSGRENIYISGSILGMSKAEIDRKFDEIVDFSGVEKFIDTPVKRYSSGMYVRLAFSVAAHLEPDILIVDEVLAVGDADFQKKCMGKMREVSTNKGRTILFVSHSMQAIQNLCSKALLLKNGEVVTAGETQSVVNRYLSGISKTFMYQKFESPASAPGNDSVRVRSVELVPEFISGLTVIDIRTPIRLKFSFWNLEENIELNTGVHLFNHAGDCIFDVASPASVYQKGVIEAECDIPGNFLNDGSYYFSIIFVKDTGTQLFYYENCVSFEVEDYRENTSWYGKWMGAVRPKFPFTMVQKDTIK